MEHHTDARDATCIKDLFSALWLQKHEWLIDDGYGLERIQQLKRPEVTLFIKEGTVVEKTYYWTIRGDFDSKEQYDAWKGFLEVAQTCGRGEAKGQRKILTKFDRMKRLACVPDLVGNLYNC
jgi:hypothetical protein